MVRQEGSKVVVDASVVGSVFPTSERELAFPVLVNGEREPIRIEGSLYGRSVELRGGVRVDGPVVSRGDTRLVPSASAIKLLSGVTVNGSLNVAPPVSGGGASASPSARASRVIIKGDIAGNQSVALRDCVVFGSVHAVNCTLENSVVLGTCVVSESLRVCGSTLGGYAARDVAFEGRCMILNALGESLTRPLFLPRETPAGGVEACDIRFYPVIRSAGSLLNHEALATQPLAEHARMHPVADWVRARTVPNPALGESDGDALEKWVLSIGGRVSDLSAIQESITSLARMLKCGFEFEHYHPDHRPRHLAEALRGLTEDESWVLSEVCAA